jgi:hypothetical protein
MEFIAKDADGKSRKVDVWGFADLATSTATVRPNGSGPATLPMLPQPRPDVLQQAAPAPQAPLRSG